MSGERRKVRVGTVIQDRMDKTVVVAVEWRRPHKLYRKPVRRRSRFYAHDEANQCRIGDEVRIIETRPLSKLKRWRVVEVLSSTDIAEIAPQEIDREIIEGAESTQAESDEMVEAVSTAVAIEQADDAPKEAAEEAVQEEAAPDAPVAEADAGGDEDASAPEAPVAEADAGDDEDAPAPEAPVAEADAGGDEDAPTPEAPVAEAPAEEAAAEAEAAEDVAADESEAADEGEAEEKKETSE